MTPSNDDLQFIEQVRARGLVSEEQIAEILAIQEQVAAMGVPDEIGSLMVKRGMLKAELAEEIYGDIRPQKPHRQIEGYQLLRPIGQGGMATVYLARQDAMDRLVALKILKKTQDGQAKLLERLKREAQIVGRLQHPGIVRGLDIGESNGSTYFAMEYVEGKTIRDRLKSGRRFTEKDALRIVRELADALEHAWTEGVTHRDVKPGNVMITPEGKALLMDYGLAKAPIDGDLTETNATLGTPQYIPPEQARNPRDADIRSDIYSLGATFYHMVTGKPPYDGENLAEIVTKVLLRPHDPPQALNPKLSRDAAFLIDKMMAKDPKQRHQTPRDLLRDLDKLDAGKPVAPPDWEGDWNAYVLRRSYRRRMILVAVVVVVALGAIFAFMVDQDRAREEIANRDAVAANMRAVAAEEAVTFDRIVTIHEQWVEVARRHGDRVEGARSSAERWGRIHEAHDKVIAVGVNVAARPANDFIGRIGLLRALEEQAAVHPVVTAEIDAQLADEIESATIEAEGRLFGIDNNPQLSLDERRVALEELSAALDEHWPEDVATDTRRNLSIGRQDLEQIVAAIEHLKTDVEFHVEAYGGDHVDGPGEYHELASAIEAAMRQAVDEAKNRKALDRAPAAVKQEFDRIVREAKAVAADQDEAGRRALLARVESEVFAGKSNDPARLQAWVERLEERAARALARSRGAYTRQAGNVRNEIARRRRIAREQFAPERERFRRYLFQRSYVGAADILSGFEERLGDWDGALAPWIQEDLDRCRAEVESCRETLGRARTALAKMIGKTGELRRGTGVGIKGKIAAVEGATLEDTKITVERDPRPEEVRLISLATESVLVWAGLSPEPTVKADRVRAGLFRLLSESPEEADLRLERRRLERIQLLVETSIYKAELAATLGAVNRSQAEREAAALKLFTDGEKLRDENKPRTALPYYKDLLGIPKYRNTDFVDKYVSEIERGLEQVEREIKSNETGKGRFEGHVDWKYLDPIEWLGRGRTRARVTFHLDHPRSLRDFEIATGRATIRPLIVRVPLFATVRPKWPADDELVEVRSVLEFKQGAKNADRLQYHPLVLENPFLTRDRIVLECRVSSPKPVFFGLSLGGACAGILSQDDIVEGGRGVAFWTKGGLRDVDRESVFQRLRTTAATNAINSRSDADERRRLEDTTYFRMRPGRWYRVRFEKGKRDAALFVDGREVGRWKFDGASVIDRNRIMILTYTTTRIDELRIEGFVDPRWEKKR